MRLEINIRREGNEVVLLKDGDGVAFSSGMAKEIYLDMKAHRKLAQQSAAYAGQSAFGHLTMVCNPMGVHFLKVGKQWFDAPWQYASQIARGLYTIALQIEEDRNWEDVVSDGTVLCMAGVPIGLTNDPRKKRLIAQEAGNISAGGVYEGVVGTPAIRHSI